MAENSVEHCGGKGPRTPERIKELFDAHAAKVRRSRGRGCGADLNAAHAAKAELATLSAAELHEALARRRDSLRDAT